MVSLDFGTTTPVLCPSGSFCSGKSVSPEPCPIGTFNNRTGLSNETQCTLCTESKYCSTSGLTSPDGDCSPGYYCTRGAADGKGNVGKFGGEGGICPVGSYCPAGSSIPLKCSKGTYNSKTGRSQPSDCIDCPAGYYCEFSGLAEPTGKCADGYYCDGADSISMPSDKICPKGHYCVSGAAVPTPCSDGYYQDNEGQISCKLCPSGSYCRNAQVLPVPCPENYYCGNGTAYPSKCPDGTYSNATNIEEVQECLPCPSGKYCRSGAIAGSCIAGHICYYENSVPDPVKFGDRGDVCPVGAYCPEGTNAPIMCKNGTVNYNTGGTSEADCEVCTPGYWCIEGIALPVKCPPGYYCEAHTLTPTPCPVGTFQPEEIVSNRSGCLPCEAGYYCPESALTTYDGYICPYGHYCITGSSAPEACPISTFNNVSASPDLSYCTKCPGGYICDTPANIEPLECEEGYYCPTGSSNQTICPSGFYCPRRTADPITCPEGYYCPAFNSVPIHCTASGSYCPLGSDYPQVCPLGYKSRNDSFLRISMNDSCSQCPAGYYGNDPERRFCEICYAGYICLEGATQPDPTDPSENGYICPAGFYCPSGATEPLPCPPGFHGKTAGLTGLESCTNCSSGSYQDLYGQSVCKPCGSSAYSEVAATTCICNGTYRVYQKTDGSCICEPGYVFYSDSTKSSEADGTIDCQPIVYDRCQNDYVRNSQGVCVPHSTSHCKAVCGEDGGNVAVDTGFCECNSIVDESEVCDSKCRDNQLSLRVNPETNTLEIYDPKTGTTVGTFDSDSVNAGSLQCTSSSCNLRMMKMDDNGFTGVYNPQSEYISELLNSTDIATVRSRKIVEESNVVGIVSPAVCLLLGEGLVFDLTHGKEHYPVYMKDSLINKNNNFDYGEFRRLAQLMKSNITISTFTFIFNEPGIYVFADNADNTKLTIVKVMAANQDCPTSAFYRPITTTNLVSLGVTKRGKLLLTPNWILVGVLLLSGFILIGLLILGVHFFRTRSWRISTALKPNYKKMLPIEDLETKGTTYSQRKLFSSGQADGITNISSDDVIDLEGFNVKVFYDKLKKHSKGVAESLGKHEEQAMSLYDKILAETDAIRLMLEDKLSNPPVITEKERIIEVEKKPRVTFSDQASQNTPRGVTDTATQLTPRLNETISTNTQFEIQQQVQQDQRVQVETGTSGMQTAQRQSHATGIQTTPRSTSAIEVQTTPRENQVQTSSSNTQTTPRGDNGSQQMNQVQSQQNLLEQRLQQQLDQQQQLLLRQQQMQQQQPVIQLSEDMADILKDFLSNTLSDLFREHGYKESRGASRPPSQMDGMEDSDSEDEFDVKDHIRSNEEEDSILTARSMRSLRSLRERNQSSALSVRMDDLEAEYSDDDTESIASDAGIIGVEDESEKKRIILHNKLKKKAKELKKKQIKELNDLNAQIKEEFETDKKKIGTTIDEIIEGRVKYLKEKHQKLKEKLEGDPTINQRQRVKMLDDIVNEIEEYTKSMEHEKRSQEELLKQVLEGKRMRKKHILDMKHTIEQQMQEDESQFERKSLEAILEQAEASKNDPTAAKNVALELLKQKNLLENQLHERRKRSEDKQKRQKEIIDDVLRKEEEAEKIALSQKAEVLGTNMAVIKKRDIEARIDTADEEKEKDKIIDVYRQILQEFEQKLVQEREKQEKDLEKKIESKKNQVETQLKSQQALEQQEVIEQQQKELDQLRAVMQNFNDSHKKLKDENAMKEQQIQALKFQQKLDAMKKSQEQKKKERQIEQERLERQIEEEKKQEQARIQAQIEQEKKKKIAEQEKQVKENIKQQNLDQQMQKKVLSEFENNKKQLDAQMTFIQNTQLEELERKMAEKKRLMAEKLQREHQEQMSMELEEQEKQLNEFSTGSSVKETASVSVVVEETQEQNELKHKNAMELEQLKKKQQQEADMELERVRLQMEQELSKKKELIKQKNDAKLKELEKEMQNQANESNDKKKNQILEDFESNKKKFEQSNKMEQLKQEQEFQALLEQAKLKMQTKNANDLILKKKEQERVESELRMKNLLQAEKKAILSIILEGTVPVSCVADAVDVVVVPRMNKELQSLPTKYEEVYKPEKLKIIQGKLQKKKIQLQALQDQYLIEGNREEAASVGEQLAKLQTDIQTEVDLLNRDSDIEMAQERVEMKQRHIQEKNILCKEFEEYESLLAARSEENKRIKDALEAFAKQIEDEKERNKQQIEVQKKKVMEELEAQYQEEINAETAKIKEQIEKERNKISVQELIKEKEEEVQRILEKQKNMEKDQREKILAQHEIDIQQFQDAIEDERIRQDELLKKKIDELLAEQLKRKRQQAAEQANQMFSKKEDPLESEQKRSVVNRALARWQLAHHSFKTAAEMPNRSFALNLGNIRASTSLGKAIQAPPRSTSRTSDREPSRKPQFDEKAWMNMLMKSPLYGKLRNIERMITKQVRLSVGPTNTYVDDVDKAIENEGELTEVNPTELEPRQFILYKFGLDFVYKTLRNRFRFQPFKIMLAKSLPKTNYDGNSFKNSFFYDKAKQALFIRDKRLTSVGDYTMVLIHCICHIVAEDLNNDNNPEFMRCFYQAMSLICEDLFALKAGELAQNDEKTKHLFEKDSQFDISFDKPAAKESEIILNMRKSAVTSQLKESFEVEQTLKPRQRARGLSRAHLQSELQDIQSQLEEQTTVTKRSQQQLADMKRDLAKERMTLTRMTEDDADSVLIEKQKGRVNNLAQMINTIQARHERHILIEQKLQDKLSTTTTLVDEKKNLEGRNN